MMPGVRGPGLLALAACLSSCEKPPSSAPATAAGPMPQFAYVWQREWTDAVRAAVSEHAGDFAGMAVLGAQLSWENGVQKTVRPPVDWRAFDKSGRAVAAVIRLEKPVPADPAEAVLLEARRLIVEAQTAGLTLSEVQVDYDAPQKKLAAYTPWLRKVERSLEPLPVRITTLASWLGEPEFLTLIAAGDGYILQVHSFDPPAPGQRPAVCDVQKARARVEQAAKLGMPFAVALPTYRTTAGYDAAGKIVGVATDSGPPQWPPGTVRQEFPAPAADIAALVAEWMQRRPAALTGIYWYRLPVATDARNWRWPALAAVMSGRAPLSRLEVKTTGISPLDVILTNTGDQDEWLPQAVTLTWSGPAPAAGDAVAGWTLTAEEGRAVFSLPPQPAARLLPAGKTTALGWLRFHENTPAPNTLRTVIDPAPASAARDR